MGSDLAMLQSLSNDKHLRHLVETIIIKDDCEKLDPWVASEFPSEDIPYDIWPREEGVVITSDIGVAELTTMLRERLLHPKTIRIRDYRIQPGNLNWCPEVARFQTLIKDTPPLRGVELANQSGVGVASFARDVIAGSGLALTSVVMRYVGSDVPLNDDSVWRTAKHDHVQGTSIGNPSVWDAILEISPDRGHQTNVTSALLSAELRLGREATEYWLEQVFYNAPILRSLFLSIARPWGESLVGLVPDRVVPKLTEFTMAATTIPASKILAMLASSKESLTSISFRMVTLAEGMYWQELLMVFAEEFHALDAFDIRLARDRLEGSPCLDFRKLKQDPDCVPEECRPDLQCVEKGPENNKRVVRISYKGSHGASMLRAMSVHAQKAIPN